MKTSISHLISEDTRKEMNELKILINKNVVIPKQPRLCTYCRKEIVYSKSHTGQGYIKNGFCDALCQEQVINKRTFKPHFCKYCSEPTFSGLNKDGHSTGVYPKYCEECREKGRHLNTGKKLPARRLLITNN